MSNIIKVVAAVLDKEQLLLYREDGSTLSIKQGDPRLAEIVNKIMPILAQPGQVAEVDLNPPENVYFQQEKKSNGLIRFFKVAKESVKQLFSGTKKEEASAPSPAPVVQASPAPSPVTPATPDPQLEKAVQSILENATPVNSFGFTEEGVGDDPKDTHTIVAVVENTVIPGVEKIKTHIATDNKFESSKAMEAFMLRLKKVIKEREHSVEDLLKFMQRNDMPIAEDGRIIAYKILRRETGVPHRYVDCHTGNVSQTVGSYVHMDKELVDPNRANDCSNGLHVARRAYIGNFGGDVIVLIKVAPEDVIAVPKYDSNKMRVCGYHILMELSKEAFALLKSNKPFTSTEQNQKILANVMQGKHIGITEYVKIGGHKGTNVTITPANIPAKAENAKPKPKPETAIKTAEAINVDEALAPLPPSPALNPKDVVEEVKAIKAGIIQGSPRRDKAQSLFAEATTSTDSVKAKAAAQELLALKKQAKVGWDRLGLSADAEAKLLNIVAG